MPRLPHSHPESARVPAERASPVAFLPRDSLRLRLFGIDWRAITAFRVAVAVLLLVDLAQRLPDLRAHYTDAGVLPRSVLGNFGSLHFSLHAASGDAWLQLLLFGGAAACAVALLIGYRVVLASFASWCLLASLHARNPLVLQGSDVLLRVLLFWSLFLPVGAKASATSKANARETRVVSVGTAAILIQFAAVYLFTAALKRHAWWTEQNSAISHALAVEQFTTSFGRSLVNYPSLLNALTFAIYRLEWLGPILVFLPWFSERIRLVVAFCFVCLHLGMAAALQLGLFPWVCIAGWILFLPVPFWDRLADTRGGARLCAHFAARAAPDRSWSTTVAAQCAAGALLLLVLLWNVRGLELPAPNTPPPPKMWYDDVLRLLRLEQKWTMFAPRPSTESGWFVVPAKLKNGTEVDLYNEMSPVVWTKPEDVAASYRNQHWRKYLIGLKRKTPARLRRLYVEFLCREWNRRHDDSAQVVSAELCIMTQDFAKPGAAEPARVMLSSYRASVSEPKPAETDPAGTYASVPPEP